MDHRADDPPPLLALPDRGAPLIMAGASRFAVRATSPSESHLHPSRVSGDSGAAIAARRCRCRCRRPHARRAASGAPPDAGAVGAVGSRPGHGRCSGHPRSRAAPRVPDRRPAAAAGPRDHVPARPRDRRPRPSRNPRPGPRPSDPCRRRAAPRAARTPPAPRPSCTLPQCPPTPTPRSARGEARPPI